MKTNLKTSLALIALVSIPLFFSCEEKINTNDTSKPLSIVSGSEVYQAGTNKDAGWAYIGFVPRTSRPENMKIIVSKRGFTLRAHAKFSQEEISHYAKYIVQKAKEMEEIRTGVTSVPWGKSNIKATFNMYEKAAYLKFLNEVKTNFALVPDGDFAENLEVLKKYFPDNVFYDEENEIVNLHLVYAITTGYASTKNEEWLRVAPQKGAYNIQNLEERRTYYSIEPTTHIFAGFPAFWFSGNIGIHGPIRYTTNTNLMSGKHSTISTEGKPVSKRWQLVRRPDSHNCFRMENHMEIRHIMPAYSTSSMAQPELSKIKINIIDDYDKVDLDQDGVLETIGVKYYWDNPNVPQNEARWKATYYTKGIPENLVEFEYRDPHIIQISAIKGNLDATMTHLNRIPRFVDIE